MTKDDMVGWHHRLKGHEFVQVPGDNEGQGSLVCCSPWGCKESDMTEQLNWTELNPLLMTLHQNVTKALMVNRFFRSLNKIVCPFLSPAQMEINYRNNSQPLEGTTQLSSWWSSQVWPWQWPFRASSIPLSERHLWGTVRTRRSESWLCHPLLLQ